MGEKHYIWKVGLGFKEFIPAAMLERWISLLLIVEKWEERDNFTFESSKTLISERRMERRVGKGFSIEYLLDEREKATFLFFGLIINDFFPPNYLQIPGWSFCWEKAGLEEPEGQGFFMAKWTLWPLWVCFVKYF